MKRGDDDTARLTEAQRECLRLVMAGYKSKEIAHKLGIGTDAVNKRLAAAKDTLGASSRFVAARQLAAFEAGQTSHYLVGQSLAVEPNAVAPDVGTHSATRDWGNDRPGDDYHLSEVQSAYVAAPPAVELAEQRSGLRQLFATPLRVFFIALAIGAVAAWLAQG